MRARRAISCRRSGRPKAPLTYIGWGKSTQLGYGLGLAMGAKLARPDKLCINVMGDAAIGFTGMDFETAVRERIPILTMLLNNFSMAIELDVMPVAGAEVRLHRHLRRLRRDGAGVRRLRRARLRSGRDRPGDQARQSSATQAGQPALLEFLTSKEQEFSLHPVGSVSGVLQGD